MQPRVLPPKQEPLTISGLPRAMIGDSDSLVGDRAGKAPVKQHKELIAQASRFAVDPSGRRADEVSLVHQCEGSRPPSSDQIVFHDITILHSPLSKEH